MTISENKEDTGKPASRPSKVPINWRSVFAESGFIGLSIILAFALQDWDEAKDIEERTLIALCNVKSELIFNRVLLETEYIPRQRGILALTKASIAQFDAQFDGSGQQQTQDVDLQNMLIQESLRYSAWTLAGESGYLLHANFQLATEIGALFDFQQDRFHTITERVNDAVSDYDSLLTKAPLDYFTTIASLVSEWTEQTEYLEEKYGVLFSRKDFKELKCDG